MSNLNLKAVSAIGCASVIASCSPDKNKEYKDKWSIGDQTLNSAQIEAIKTVLGKDLSPEVFGVYLVKYAEQNNIDAKDLTIEDFFNGNTLNDGIAEQLLAAKTKVENKEKQEKSIKNEDYNKLPDDIKKQLKNFAGNNDSLAKEFWDTIKSEEKIDELIKNEDLNSKYENFKKVKENKEKENRELIKNQLTKAGFDDENQAKINNYISFIDNNNIKVKLNNNSIPAYQYLLSQLKKQNEQSEIVKVVANLYKQVISEGKIKADIKNQLKSMIKSRFEKLISENDSYKMQIGIEEITIDDNNEKVQVTLSSKIKKSLKKPLLEEYTIEYEGFKVDKEELKYTEGKEEKSLPLNKLMYKDNMDLSNYQFADDDKSELDKLVTIAIKDEEYNNLPKDIQEQLTKVAENNASLAKEFWDTIKSEEKIDELIKNDQDLQSKYDKFKEEKENRELITNQLTKACFDKDNQAKINQYISFIENNIKVKLDNNTTANQYLFDQLKGKENQSEIVQGVANLYEQVISGDNIKADIKQQLKSMIKSRFEELIKEDASYKENIEIKETDITIKDNGEVTVKLSSKIQNSLSKEYTITYKFFEVEAEDLKYTEDKNNGAQSLSLNKLMYQDGKDLSKYQFADKDKTELKKLVTDKKIVRDNIENVFKNYTIGDIKNYDKLKDEATKIQDLINNFLKYIAQGKDNNGKAIEAVTTSDDIYKLFNNDPKQGETDFKDAVNKWINQYIINQLKGKINNIQNDKTLQKNVGKKAIIFTNLMKINDLLQLNKLQIQNTGQTALKYLNDKFTNDFKTKYIGDTNSKIEFKNNGEIDNFVIGNAFETIDENTTNIKSNGADDKIKLEKIKQKLQTTLSSEFNKRLKVVKIESEGELKTIGKRFLEMLDNVNIEIPDTYNFEKALNDYNDTNQFVEGKKFTDLQDEDLNALVEPVLKSVFGDAAICKDVFDKLNAFNEEGNKVCNDGNNNENPTKTICEGSIATISGSSDGKKPEQRQAAQTHFTKTLGKALWNLRVALNDLYTTSGASNEWTTLLKKQIFGQLYFKINTDEGADDDESGTNIPCIAMKNTLLFKWLYVTKDTYAKNDDKKKNCVIKSIQRIIHMRFKNLTTKFHNGVNTTNAGTDFFTCNNNDINTIGLDEIGKAVQDFSNLTFVLPLSEQGISITDKAGSNAWDMDNVNFKVHKCGTKKIVENELIFVKDKECIEANYLLGMCGDWNGKVAKIEYYNSASKSKQQAKVTDTIKNN